METLSDLLDVLGDRDVALCRELTKLHEEVRRCTLAQAAAYYAETPPRGEFVLVVEGAPPVEEEGFTLEDGLERVDRLLAQGLSTRDAVKQAAAELGLSRKALYDRAVSRD